MIARTGRPRLPAGSAADMTIHENRTYKKQGYIINIISEASRGCQLENRASAEQRSKPLTAEQMHVQMVHHLPAFGIAIVDEAVTPFLDSKLFRDLLCGQGDIAEQMGVLRRDVVHRRDVLLRDEQHMNRRRRLNIVESENGIGFEHLLRRDRPFYDFAENAIHDERCTSVSFSMFVYILTQGCRNVQRDV